MKREFPELLGIDHVHLLVPDKAQAAHWYSENLGFHIVESLRDWDTPTGPLTIADASGRVHLALFQADAYTPLKALAFKASGAGLLAWQRHLQGLGLSLRTADHGASCSLYFTDPFGHYHEITSPETEPIRAAWN